MQMAFPAVFSPEKEGGYSVTFRDFPDAFTCGDTYQQAYVMAEDCLAEAVATRMIHREDIPKPSRGSALVPVPLWLALKAVLYQTLKDRHLSKVKLAKEMGVTEGVIRQMIDPKRKGSSAKSFLDALSALGVNVSISSISRKRPTKARGEKIRGRALAR
jgi:antitoxin HicB